MIIPCKLIGIILGSNKAMIQNNRGIVPNAKPYGNWTMEIIIAIEKLFGL